MREQAFIYGTFSAKSGAIALGRQGICNVRPTFHLRQLAPRMLTTGAIGNKCYQLEEMEDEASSTSSLFLRKDGKISYGRTDGPQPTTVDGFWLYDEDQRELRVEIERVFDDGRVQFPIRRALRGHLDCPDDTEAAVFAGNIFRDSSDFSDPKSALGHWTMIAADGLSAEEFDK